MDVTQQLANAWAAVEGSGLPEHLHEAGFKAALSLQSPEFATTAPASVSTPVALPAAAPAQGPLIAVSGMSDGSDPMARFAHETGIPQEALEEVFFFHDGLPVLNGPGRKLGNSKATQTRTIALALTAAYHFALGDTSDALVAVRKECERQRCYDNVNFSTNLSSTKGVNYVGPRNKKVLKAKSDTISELKVAISTIRGTEA